MNLAAQSMLKLSEAASRIPELKLRWRELIRVRTVDVPGVGPHHLQDSGWLVFERRLAGHPSGIAAELTKLGDSLLRFVDTFQ
jgi:hypothetical protein